MSGTSSQKFSKKSPQESASSPKHEWKGFIDVPLTTEDKARFEIWRGEAEDLLAAVGAAVADGYKLSVSYDQRNNCFQAALTGMLGAAENVGFTMVGRAGTPDKAIAVVMFKHFELAQQGPWSNLVGPGRGDDIS
jgi:hypothetical protein